MADGRIIIDTSIDTTQAEKDAKSLKSQAASLAAVYRKQGMSMSDAMKRAWSEIERTTKSGAKNSRRTINKEFSGAAADLKSTMTTIGHTLMSAIGTVSFVTLAKECIELGSAVEEVQNVVDTAFGAMAYKMEEFADKAITSYGISQLAAKQTGSNYMAMARGMGIAEDAASDMAIALTGLSADVASFYNITQDEAATKLKSVFTGETETLKDLGVVMTQTNLEQYALTKGIKKNISAMTQAEITTLRYHYVLDSLDIASGDFVRTQDSWANQTRILSEQMKQLGANVGTIMTTVLLPAVKGLNEIVSSLVTATNEVVRAINVIKGNTSQNKTTSSSASDAADAEYELADGIEAAAEAAEKSRAGFDELNVLQANTADTAAAAGNSVSSTTSSSAEVGNIDTPDWAKSLSETIMSLGVTINDVVFEWEDLSGEQIAKKVITGLAGLVGAGLGFMIGGAPGAVKGSLLGVELGLIVSGIIFDGDGSISEEEIIKSLVVALGTIGGGIIGFSFGGPAGAAIGATVGLGLSLALSQVSFDGDGLIGKNEFLKVLVSALNGILGGVIGFFLGGPLGAAIGAVIGFGLTFALTDIDFGGNDSKEGGFLDGIFAPPDEDNGGGFIDTVKKKVSDLGEWADEKFQDISDAISVWFSKAEEGSEEEYVKPTQTSMNKLGDKISSIFEVTSDDIANNFSAANRSINTGFTQPTKTGMTGLSGWITEKIGSSCAGVVTDFVSANKGVSTGFTDPTKTGVTGLGDWIAEKLGLTCAGVISDFSVANRSIDIGFTQPTKSGMTGLGSWIAEKLGLSSDKVVSDFNVANRSVNTGFTSPTKSGMASLSDWISQKLGLSCSSITNDFSRANSDLNTGFTVPTRRSFETTGKLIAGVFSDSKDGVMKDWKNLSPWFERDVFTPLGGGFKGMVNKNILLLNALLSGITKGVNGVIEALNRFKIKLPNWKALGDMAGGTLGFNIQTMTAPQIPYLAQGTVIPPNQEFLAVLGDQKHGTNIEAPLSTIQEAVAVVMEDMIQSNIAGQEAILMVLKNILEAVLGIEIGDDKIANAVSRYNMKIAVVKGG